MWSTLLTSLAFYPLLSTFTTAAALPSQDPWYNQPSNISKYAAGELIRSRVVNPELEAFSSLPVNVSVKAVFQYLYRTTNSVGDAAASVVTLIEPHNSDPTKLLGYQTYYDSANVDSSPSYTLQAADEETLAAIEADVLLIGAALNLGWWVYTTDYEGLQAEYTAGLQSGHAVLDSTRVVLSAGPAVGLSCDPQYALWGYSGGSLASMWAAELQPSYAPELNFSGVAVGGTVPNVASVIKSINNGSSAGLAFSAVYGQAKAFPNMTEWLDGSLIKSKSDKFYAIANGTYPQAAAAGKDQDIYSYFKGGEAAFNDEVPQSVLKWSGQLGLHGTPNTPLFLYKGVEDETSPVTDTDDIIAGYCAGGARIEYHRDLIGTHASEGVSGSANALLWLSDRLDGKDVSSSGCSTEVVALLSVNVEALPLLGGELFGILESALAGLL
ncbi:putative lipase 2 precursor [Aspergillus heterothallicus]